MSTSAVESEMVCDAASLKGPESAARKKAECWQRMPLWREKTMAEGPTLTEMMVSNKVLDVC